MQYLHKRIFHIMKKGVAPFPATLCISINDVVIHGIPSKKIILNEGDIVSVDLVVLKNGFHGDCARTYIVGETSPEAKKIGRYNKTSFLRRHQICEKWK